MKGNGSAVAEKQSIRVKKLPDGRVLRVTHGELALLSEGRDPARKPLWTSSISMIGPTDVEDIRVENDRICLLRQNTILVSRHLKDGTPC